MKTVDQAMPYSPPSNFDWNNEMSRLWLWFVYSLFNTKNQPALVSAIFAVLFVVACEQQQ